MLVLIFLVHSCAITYGQVSSWVMWTAATPADQRQHPLLIIPC